MANRRFVCLIAFLTCFFGAMYAQTFAADKPLRWEFSKGQAFEYQIVQAMALDITIAATKSSTTVDQTIDLKWTVDDVNAETGDAEVTQEITRIQMTLNSPATGEVKFDSDSEEETGAVGKMLSPVISSLVGAKFQFRISPRGDINEVKEPADVLAALKKVPGAKMFGGMFDKKSFRNMIKQSSMVLPEKVVDKGWTNTQPHVIKNELLGKMTADTTYTFAGDAAVDGVALAKFDIALKVAFDEDRKRLAKVSIKEQESKGALYFNPAKHRLERSHVEQTMQLEIEIAGQKIEQQIKSDTRLHVKDGAS
ncbi:MAG: DUF6263 family protein [Pirellulales bacterium]|nr:DUF6263 family protein [Pirellulales bacterium]